jgi:hypothetical protein
VSQLKKLKIEKKELQLTTISDIALEFTTKIKFSALHAQQ